jgi:hypothetical protein
MDTAKGYGKGIDPGLKAVIEAWPELPEPIRRAMELLVSSR